MNTELLFIRTEKLKTFVVEESGVMQLKDRVSTQKTVTKMIKSSGSIYKENTDNLMFHF